MRYLFGTYANVLDIKHKVAATPFIVETRLCG